VHSLHKLREAMAEEMRGVVGGDGKVAEIDGGYFGGYVKPANQKEYRPDHRYTRNQHGQRKVVVVVRERGGNSAPAVFGAESQAGAFIRARIALGTVVHADEAGSWDGLHDRFEMKRINHQEAYTLTVLAPTMLRNISAACAVPRSAFTITLPGRICSAMRRKVHGVRITAASRMAIR
jgi:ISXO2-like transposase domain